MGRDYKKKQELEKKLAKERIKELFGQAKAASKEESDLKSANRYITLARKIAMKFRVRIPPELKRQFCKFCYCFFIPGKTARVRTKEGNVVYTCFSCKKIYRIPYKPKKVSKERTRQDRKKAPQKEKKTA